MQAQKLKPLINAPGVIGLIFTLIVYARGFIRSLV